MKPLTIIAEAGVNHDGSLEKALALVEVAARAGADVVKFQIFHADALASRRAELAPYQESGTETTDQVEMLRQLELGRDDFLRILAECRRLGIAFAATPFDPSSLEFLDRELDPPFIKIGSGDLTNAPLLFAAARTGRRIILSTGMAVLEEVRDAVGVLGYGLMGEAPGVDADFGAWVEDKVLRADLARRVTLLHCTTAYPTPMQGVNLRAMETLADRFGLPVGYSDHTIGADASLAAVAKGACVIEKHFTLDKTASGPDHNASMDPDELADFVSRIRSVQEALGDGLKQPGAVEQENIMAARRSLTACQAIAAGELFSDSNLTVKRPQAGLSPFAYWRLLGRPAKRSYAPDEAIEPGELRDE